RALHNGGRLMADTRNHRVLSVSTHDGGARPIALPDSGLCDPTYAEELPDGNVLVCDTGNGRVIELNREGQIVWDYGDAIAARRHLSYPRSVELTGADRYLVADTGHNRIVEFAAGGVEERPFRAEFPLF